MPRSGCFFASSFDAPSTAGGCCFFFFNFPSFENPPQRSIPAAKRRKFLAGGVSRRFPNERKLSSSFSSSFASSYEAPSTAGGRCFFFFNFPNYETPTPRSLPAAKRRKCLAGGVSRRFPDERILSSSFSSFASSLTSPNTKTQPYALNQPRSGESI
jgi:hypothetical protein